MHPDIKVVPDCPSDELLQQLHRRWMETRDPRDGAKFAAMVNSMSKASQVPNGEHS